MSHEARASGAAPTYAVEVPDAAAMQALGVAVAARLRPGDLVLLGGDLGAGKTTLTQGIGDGLGVRGPVTSPTFVIARVHPSLVEGPALVHVDAYRLSGWDELEDIDLEATLEDSVTVVEWGEGLAEGLAGDRLEIHIDRRRAGGAAPTAETESVDSAGDARHVRLAGVGRRWADADLAELAAPHE